MYFGYKALTYISLSQATTIGFTKVFFTVILSSIFLNEKIPLVLGDRFILRESGRNQTVGGGQILDPAPVLKASKAKPDNSIEKLNFNYQEV